MRQARQEELDQIPPEPEPESNQMEENNGPGALVAYLLEPPRDDQAFWVIRVAAYLVFFVWGWWFIFTDYRTDEIGSSFLHGVNLVFHEAGHVIFQLFGDFMGVLGGTLGQLLMPLIATVALVVKNRDNFGASLGLWWFSQSLMDCAPYIYDARAMNLTLLGGVSGHDMPGYHDWNNILGRLGWLEYDHGLAGFVDFLGTLGMLLAFLWGGLVLYRQYQRIASAHA